jgi:hypothetical protein
LQALLLREWQEQQMEWRLVERKLQATIARLQAQAQDAADGREQAVQRLEEVTLRLKAVEREAADVTSLYREAKAGEQPQSLAKLLQSPERAAFPRFALRSRSLNEICGLE